MTRRTAMFGALPLIFTPWKFIKRPRPVVNQFVWYPSSTAWLTAKHIRVGNAVTYTRSYAGTYIDGAIVDDTFYLPKEKHLMYWENTGDSKKPASSITGQVLEINHEERYIILGF